MRRKSKLRVKYENKNKKGERIKMIGGIIITIIFLILLWLFYTRFIGAEYYPTFHKRIRKMILMSKLKKKDIAYDLGCGDGRIVIEASKICKKAIGIEFDYIRYLIALIRVKLSKRKNIIIKRGNFMNYPIKPGSVIFIFLTKKGNEMLRQKLLRIKNLRIVSHHWKFKNWKPIQQDKKLQLYAYRT